MDVKAYSRRIAWIYDDIQPLRRTIAHIARLFFVTLRWLHILPKRSDVSIWLIGEAHGECQPDNGFYFFQYCRREHPDKETYFITRRKSLPDTINYKTGNIIEYGSVRHIMIYLEAKVCFYTHTYSDIIFREMLNTKNPSKRLVFLHHSTLGFKKFDKRYLKNRNLMDIFTIGSNTEREILINDIGVDRNRLKMTGYARYDILSNNCADDLLQIAYMPTHRDWLRAAGKEFVESNFYKQIEALLSSPKLHYLLKTYGAILKVRLHPANIAFSHMLSTPHPHIHIIQSNGETPLDLICESHILITDYSGVAFDFIYLSKPVLFYRFDADEYIKTRGSYIDLSNEKFGNIYYEPDSLVQELGKIISENCKIDSARKLVRDELMTKMDNMNCHRIFQLAENAWP